MNKYTYAELQDELPQKFTEVARHKAKLLLQKQAELMFDSMVIHMDRDLFIRDATSEVEVEIFLKQSKFWVDTKQETITIIQRWETDYED